MSVCDYKRVSRCVARNGSFSFCKLLLAVFLTILFIIYASRHQHWNNTVGKLYSDSKRFLRTGIHKKPILLEKEAEILLQTSWIKYFPSLQHLVKTLGDLNHRGNITSAKYTTLKLQEENHYQVGGELKATIIAYDENKVRKKHGGDFFLAVLRRPGFAIDGVSCKVFDSLNGVYDVNCILPWKEKAMLIVTLVHPAESVYHLMKLHNSEEQYGILTVAKVLDSKNKTEMITCTVGFRDKNASELCDYSNPVHGEKWTCQKTTSGECPPIIWEEDNKVDMSKLNFFDKKYFRKDINHNVPIHGSSAHIFIKEGTSFHSYFKGNLSEVNTNPSAPNGWFFESEWYSTKTNILPFTKERLQAWVRNKSMYFIGDSTISQWFYQFLEHLKLKHYAPDNRRACTKPRESESKELNADFHIRAHGRPLRNPGPPTCKPYISNTLDAIQLKKNGREIIVLITIGLHFELTNPEIYYRRLLIIKQSLESLITRIPNVKVVIKGLPWHTYTKNIPTTWKSYIYDVLLRHTLGNVKGAIYYDCYDYTFLAKITDVHPKTPRVDVMIELLLSFIYS